MFGNRKMKREILQLENDVNTLQENIKILRADRDKQADNVLRRTSERDYANGLLKDRTKELDELKTKVRAQNEADLMFVSVKIISELLKDKKLKDKNVVSMQENLQNYATAYQQAQQSQGNGSSSMAGFRTILGF